MNSLTNGQNMKEEIHGMFVGVDSRCFTACAPFVTISYSG
jgi:hypothetical protein